MESSNRNAAQRLPSDSDVSLNLFGSRQPGEAKLVWALLDRVETLAYLTGFLRALPTTLIVSGIRLVPAHLAD